MAVTTREPDMIETETEEDIVDMTERTETPMIFIEFSKKKRGFYRPMNFFKGFRELRIPFIMLKETMPMPDFKKILVSVGSSGR